MKRIFLFAALAAMVITLVIGCSQKGVGEAFAGSPRPWSQTVITLDTLNNGETITQALGQFFSPIYYEVQVAADSISGATAATATLQQSIDNGTNWTTLGTVTINGVSTRSKLSGNILGGNIRLQTVSTGTQVTTLTTSYITAGKPD